MNPENIRYMAKVNAACWLIRKARKIAMELPNMTHDQRQEIELEIVDIGMRLYNETRQHPEPEATHNPGEDHELAAYIAAVRELVPDAERLVIEQYRENHGISPEEAAKRWKTWRQVQECKQ